MTTSNTYILQIRGRTIFGWTSFTKEKLISIRSITIEKSLTENHVDNKKTYSIIFLMVLSLISIAIILTLICMKK